MNPDNEVDVTHPEGLAVMVKRPVWMFIGDQMVEMMLMLQSIKEAEVLDEIYLAALNRHPSTTPTINYELVNEKTKVKSKVSVSEKVFIENQLKTLKNSSEFSKDMAAAYRAFYEDVFWALLNTNEFILNH